MIGFSREATNSYIQNGGDPEKSKVIFNVNLIKNEKEERDKRIVLSATQYSDGTNLVVDLQSDANTPSIFTQLPVNQLLKDGEKASPEKFTQKINVTYEILINENDEINMRVLDAEIVYKFNIDEATLDNTPKIETFY